MTDWLRIGRGTAPLIVAIPHAGTHIPGDCATGLVDERALVDTDWHVDRLYAFAAGLGATVVATGIARTVIDVNRDPSGASLYPGQATTDLCPLTTFDGAPLYTPGRAPDEPAVADRRRRFHAPYHAALAAEVARLRTRHPAIVVYDAHSIRSTVPRLFDGVLPQFNIGSVGGASCAAALVASMMAACTASGHTVIIDGRFRGGWTTRHHGAPGSGVHAIQMELAQRGYCDEADPVWDAARAAPMQAVLARILAAAIDFAKAQP